MKSSSKMDCFISESVFVSVSVYEEINTRAETVEIDIVVALMSSI